VGRVLDEEEFGRHLGSVRHTAFRLELQPAYAEPVEEGLLADFLAGDPEPPALIEGFAAWYAQVTNLTEQGCRFERVRVQEDPPTAYQRWERWVGRWNCEAGEKIRYMTREKAHDVGLLPAAGDRDWWLLDSERLIVMDYDDESRRISSQLVDDIDAVVRARAWWDLAIHNSAPLVGSTAR
jgi:hypothetical protein